MAKDPLKEAARLMGRKGGKAGFGERKASGGRKAAANMTDQEKRERAQKAAKARWSKRKPK